MRSGTTATRSRNSASRRRAGAIAQQLGFDGVRTTVNSSPRDIDSLTARNAGSDFNSDASEEADGEESQEASYKNKPDYLFAYNTHVDFRWNVKADNSPLAFREKCKDNGVIAQEEMAFTGNAPWEDYIKTVRHNSDLVRFYGGQHAAYPLTPADLRGAGSVHHPRPLPADEMFCVRVRHEAAGRRRSCREIQHAIRRPVVG